MILPGVPRGDHTDATGASLQLSLLCHALPPCHVLHSGQVKIVTKFYLLIICMAGDDVLLPYVRHLLRDLYARHVGANCGRFTGRTSILEKAPHDCLHHQV